MAVCHGASLLSLSDPCVRQFWTSLVPAVLVAIFCVFHIPVPAQAKKISVAIQAPFRNFLPLAEAEALDSGDAVEEPEASHQHGWTTLFISSLSLLETLAWLGIGSYALAVDPSAIWNYILPLLLAVSWLYAALRITLKPAVTPPFDLFILFTLQFIFSLVSISGIFYDYYISSRPVPSTWVLVGQAFNLATVSLLLGVVLRMPLAIPSKRIDPTEIVRGLSFRGNLHC